MSIFFIIIANIREISHGYLADKGDDENSDDEDNPEKKYNELKKDSIQKDQKIKELENEYFKKISEFLVLIQVHCEIKTNMYLKFKEAGLISEL